MTKSIKVAGMDISLPDYSRGVGQVIGDLTNAFEAGQVSSIFIVYVNGESMVAAATGRIIELPALAMVADEVAEHVCDGIAARFNGDDDEE